MQFKSYVKSNGYFLESECLLDLLLSFKNKRCKGPSFRAVAAVCRFASQFPPLWARQIRSSVTPLCRVVQRGRFGPHDARRSWNRRANLAMDFMVLEPFVIKSNNIRVIWGSSSVLFYVYIYICDMYIYIYLSLAISRSLLLETL